MLEIARYLELSDLEDNGTNKFDVSSGFQGNNFEFRSFE